MGFLLKIQGRRGENPSSVVDNQDAAAQAREVARLDPGFAKRFDTLERAVPHAKGVFIEVEANCHRQLRQLAASRDKGVGSLELDARSCVDDAMARTSDQ